LMAKRTKIKGRIKADLGMKVADFNAAKRLADLEADPRNEMLSTLHIVFEALDINAQLDFINVMKPDLGTAPKANKTKAAEAGKLVVPANATIKTARDAEISGYNSGIMGIPQMPRPPEIERYITFQDSYDFGYRAGMKAREDGKEIDLENPYEPAST